MGRAICALSNRHSLTATWAEVSAADALQMTVPPRMVGVQDTVSGRSGAPLAALNEVMRSVAGSRRVPGPASSVSATGHPSLPLFQEVS
jgi:hypothetical protein